MSNNLKTIWLGAAHQPQDSIHYILANLCGHERDSIPHSYVEFSDHGHTERIGQLGKCQN